jgi:uncharacterized peroxidase-related enzyme
MATLNLPLQSSQDATEPVRATLQDVQKRYGFIPNLYRIFANAPVALNAYLSVSDIFQGGTLSATERNVILLVASRENECRYCVAVHSTVADMQKDPADVTAAIREDRPIDDPRLEALRRFTEEVVRGRGQVEEQMITAFLSAGYQRAQALEVLVGVMLKTLSNYTNHLAKTPLDPVFAGRVWTPEGR